MTYTLYHGDCLDILPTLAAGSVDAVITDPPYGTTACAWDSVIPFGPMWAGIKHVLKPRGAAVLFGSQPFTSALVMSNVEWFKYEWVWQKSRPNGFLLAKTQPLRNIEDICVFNAGVYNPQGLDRVRRVMKNSKTAGGGVIRGNKSAQKNQGNLRTPSSIYIQEFASYPSQTLRFANVSDPIHPTQKPVALMEYLIRTYTNPGDTVLDFTMGSGTTGVACMKTGRNFIGIEIGADYFRIAETRIKNAAGEFVRTDKEREVGQLALFGD